MPCPLEVCAVHTKGLCWVLVMCALDLKPPIWSKAQSVCIQKILHKGSSPELDVPLLFYVEVLGFERLEGAVSLHDMAA